MQGVFMLKVDRSVFVMLISVGLLAGSCASSETTSSEPASSPAIEASPSLEAPVTAPPDASVATTADAGADATTANSHGGQGGQVIESGEYHLELLPIKEADGIHLDFFLQTGDNHEAIADAKVTAQVQLPDGSQQTLDMDYDAAGEHYVAFLPSAVAGEYNVAVLSDINGEKVNGRFTFSE
jgi:hypothetical protein